MIGIHAERVVGDDRWSAGWCPPAPLPVGRVRVAPGRFGEMLRDGNDFRRIERTHRRLAVAARRVVVGDVGTGGMAALREALVDPRAWVVEPAPGEVLEHVTADPLAGSVGDFVRSHGGSVTARPAGGDAVAVQLGGACEHCAAAEFTLRARLFGELRRRCPDLVEVDRGGGGLTVTLGG